MIGDLEKYNVYGIRHEKVNEKFGGNMEYIGTWGVFPNQYFPCAVYKNGSPAKGEERFMLIYRDTHSGWKVKGLSKKGMNKLRYMNGVYCPLCKETVYSVYKYHVASCKCGEVRVTGGNNALMDNGKGKIVPIDLLWKSGIETGSPVEKYIRNKKGNTGDIVFDAEWERYG